MTRSKHSDGQQVGRLKLCGVRMNGIKRNKIVGRKTIKWCKCIVGVAVEYRERVKVKYEEHGEEVDNVEE